MKPTRATLLAASVLVLAAPSYAGNAAPRVRHIVLAANIDCSNPAALTKLKDINYCIKQEKRKGAAAASKTDTSAAASADAERFSSFQPAGPAAANRRVRKFMITARVGSRKLRRTWKRVSSKEWAEIYGDKSRHYFTIVTRIVLNYCPGTVVHSQSERKKYAFIPDKRCLGMPFQISYDAKSFGTVSSMRHVH